MSCAAGSASVGRAGIRQLELILSSACNLACSYCYQNDKKRGRLGWEDARAALDLALADPGEELSIHFFGGEPLLEFETLRLAVEHVAQRRPAKRIRYFLATNGLLLGTEQARFLVENDFETHLSFDGVPAAQALRGARTHDRLDALLDRLREEHGSYFRRRLVVTITFLPSTLRHLPASLRYFLAKGVRSIDLSPQSTDTSAWDPAGIAEMAAIFEEVGRICEEHHAETGRIPLRVLRRPVGEEREPILESAMCGVGEGQTLAVDADGEVYGCVTFARSYQKLTPFLDERLEPMRLGRLDEGLEQRLSRFPEATVGAEIFDHKELKFSSYGRCRDCRHLAVCSICPVTIGRQAGNRDPRRVPDFLCAYNLVVHDLRDRLTSFDERPTSTVFDEPDLMRWIGIAAEDRRRAAAERT